MSLAYIHYMSRVDSMNFNNWKSPRYTYATVECYSRQTFWLLHFTGYPAWLQRSAKSATAVQKHSQSPPLSHLFNRIHPHFTGFFSYVRKFNPHYFLGSLFKQSKINVQNDPWKKNPDYFHKNCQQNSSRKIRYNIFLCSEHYQL